MPARSRCACSSQPSRARCSCSASSVSSTSSSCGGRRSARPSWSLPVLILRRPAAVALVAFAFELIVRWGPDESRRVRWTSLGSMLVVVGWIGQRLVFAAYVRSVADFRTSVGSLEVFIFLATYFYVAAIILLVAMELDE